MTINIDALKQDKRPQSSTLVHALIDRLEAEESKQAALLDCLNEWKELAKSAEKERDDLKAKIAEMERQEPAGWQRLHKDGSSTEDIVDSPNVFIYQRPLYALPGAKGE